MSELYPPSACLHPRGHRLLINSLFRECTAHAHAPPRGLPLKRMKEKTRPYHSRPHGMEFVPSGGRPSGPSSLPPSAILRFRRRLQLRKNSCRYRAWTTGMMAGSVRSFPVTAARARRYVTQAEQTASAC